ncbi:nuclease-related domain-containing protein [Peribacillus acanthi]|uniref:nuclease-related domain-containing protein n=1 Tax=Peribacillus acanthi TaxID=2171554 RepID=UPI000D3EDFA3|nr:nuclease-related domain-containing protein [Peribacillus acanthi]
MNIKKREIPESILKLQALLRRTPVTHPKYPQIQENLSKQLAGYKGELAIEYPLSFLPEKEYFIFHDLRLKVHEFYFQMDCLLISSKFILILEIKNIAGTLYFDQNYHQLVRKQNEREEAFPDPVIQTKRHEFLLKNWLIQHGFSNVPIQSLVVISSPYTLIRSSIELSNKVIHSDYLPEKIKQIERSYVNNVLLEKEMKSISRKIVKQHHPHTSQS